MTHLKMVYLLKMVIFHGYVSHNQMVLIIFPISMATNQSDRIPCHPSDPLVSLHHVCYETAISGCVS